MQVGQQGVYSEWTKQTCQRLVEQKIGISN